MNVIFFDVDGVLNSYLSQKLENEEISSYHLQVLADLCKESSAKLVIASSWRCAKGVEEIEDTMYKYLENRLADYGMSIWDSTPLLGKSRPYEIHTWLEEHKNIPGLSYVILDDDWHPYSYEKYGLASHLVQTKFWCLTKEEGGLQPEHVKKALEVLNRRKIK